MTALISSKKHLAPIEEASKATGMDCIAHLPEHRVFDDCGDPCFQARQETNVTPIQCQVKVEVGHLNKGYLQAKASKHESLLTHDKRDGIVPYHWARHTSSDWAAANRISICCHKQNQRMLVQ